MLALRRLPVTSFRALHTSSVVARRAKPSESVEVEDDAADDLFDDLDAVASSSSSSVDRAQRRALIVDNILNKNIERVGELRKVAQLSDTPADLEGLGAVLKSWRVAGKKVTEQTAKEIVGRCINLGRPDLAKEYSSDILTYGFPVLPKATAIKLAKETKAQKA
ncbi:uncharacterized protein EHS24_009431 [Apiotrichum porosum]|uniref:Uncharacterized protein n=1 Tax=Apiotrichum porosum TaxID=105984 RepID=A0A427XLT3_9TREE|nr:uncharacterized protein EHS24_009431 [Apiotrichum porosum]RSH79773.1 hypothetical protein EHS24_009431 [Apiotrichum porosum]